MGKDITRDELRRLPAHIRRILTAIMKIATVMKYALRTLVESDSNKLPSICTIANSFGK
jgi:hypothetical protein